MLTMVALPAELLSLKMRELLLLMVALPALLESVKDSRPPPLLVMVAVPAVLKPVKVVEPGVLLMMALPAVAVECLAHPGRQRARNRRSARFGHQCDSARRCSTAAMKSGCAKTIRWLVESVIQTSAK